MLPIRYQYSNRPQALTIEIPNSSGAGVWPSRPPSHHDNRDRGQRFKLLWACCGSTHTSSRRAPSTSRSSDCNPRRVQEQAVPSQNRLQGMVRKNWKHDNNKKWLAADTKNRNSGRALKTIWHLASKCRGGGGISKGATSQSRKKLVGLAGGECQDSRYRHTPSSPDLTDVVNTQTRTWARSQMGWATGSNALTPISSRALCPGGIVKVLFQVL